MSGVRRGYHFSNTFGKNSAAISDPAGGLHWQPDLLLVFWP
ncbi:hypothetical protein SLEP1_g22651 [Rubroshorea leprosula]|uniref:Uncharacterized protein n=1 Tax=Rubroshorea leprosula TaxID=152421 RepID=A0AAV5JJ37_9ROSI|nr:hypothetical protein SLEP1_g22651 [Rubroshorea leprosula]